MSPARQDRGATGISYAALAVFASAVIGLLFTSVPGEMARACRSAVCTLFGGDCGTAGAGPGGSGGSPSPAPAAPPRWGPARGPAGGPLRAPGERTPIPRPTCTPDSKAEWAEGLHAHNDYENKHPLKDALDHGATSIEADIWMTPDGELHLQHQEDGGSRGTLRKTYVEPLIERAAANGGQVYKGRDRPFVILLEIKKGDETTYRRIIEQTRDLPPGVQLLMPADTPGAVVGQQPPNVTFYIAPGQGCTLPPKVDPASPEYDPTFARSVSMLNGSYKQCADRDGNGKISKEEQRKLNEFVAQAHDAGLKVRFVEGPDGRERDHKKAGKFKKCRWWPGRQGCENDLQEDWWKAQRAAGVDYLDTAHLTAGEKFVRDCDG